MERHDQELDSSYRQNPDKAPKHQDLLVHANGSLLCPVYHHQIFNQVYIDNVVVQEQEEEGGQGGSGESGRNDSASYGVDPDLAINYFITLTFVDKDKIE